MDDFLNQASTPVFWITNVVLAIIVAIMANRIDKQIPPLSLKWLEVSIYLYAIFGIAVSLYSYSNGSLPYLKYNPVLDDMFKDFLPLYMLNKYHDLAMIISAGFLFPMFMAFIISTTTLNTVSFHKKATIFIGTASLLSFACAFYAFVANKGWTKDAYSFFMGSAALVGLISCFFLFALVLFPKMES